MATTPPDNPATSAAESANPGLWDGGAFFYAGVPETDLFGLTTVASNTGVTSGSTAYGPAGVWDGSVEIQLSSDPLADADAATLIAVVNPAAIDGNNPIFESGNANYDHYGLWLDNQGTEGGETNCVSFDARVFGFADTGVRVESATDSISVGHDYVIIARVSTEDLAEIWIGGVNRTSYQGSGSNQKIASAGPLRFGHGQLGHMTAAASVLCGYRRRITDDEIAQIAADPYAALRPAAAARQTVTLGAGWASRADAKQNSAFRLFTQKQSNMAYASRAALGAVSAWQSRAQQTADTAWRSLHRMETSNGIAWRVRNYAQQHVSYASRATALAASSWQSRSSATKPIAWSSLVRIRASQTLAFRVRNRSDAAIAWASINRSRASAPFAWSARGQAKIGAGYQVRAAVITPFAWESRTASAGGFGYSVRATMARSSSFGIQARAFNSIAWQQYSSNADMTDNIEPVGAMDNIYQLPARAYIIKL